jgi:hypothetical protein
MRKDRLLLLGLLAVAIACVAIFWAVRWPGVTKENFGRIREGMTRTEVESIFGRPADQEVQFEHDWVDATWADGAGARVSISFGSQRVVFKGWTSLVDDRTVWQKWLDRLPWRQRQLLVTPSGADGTVTLPDT